MILCLLIFLINHADCQMSNYFPYFKPLNDSLAPPPTYAKYHKDIENYIFRNNDSTSKYIMENINVETYIDYISINEIDNSVMFNGRLFVCWLDGKLSWDPKNYGNVSQIFVNLRDKKMWFPKFQCVNCNHGVGELPSLKFISSNARIQSHGPYGIASTIVLYQAKVICDFDFTNYPNDQHNCSLIITSRDPQFNLFSMDHSRLQLKKAMENAFAKDQANITSNFKITSWFFDGGEAERIRCAITINIERHESFINVMFIIPSFICLLLTILSFSIKSKETACYLLFSTILLEFIFYKNISKKIALILQNGVLPNLFIYFGIISIFSLFTLFFNFWMLRRKQ